MLGEQKSRVPKKNFFAHSAREIVCLKPTENNDLSYNNLLLSLVQYW